MLQLTGLDYEYPKIKLKQKTSIIKSLYKKSIEKI